ncbi:MULTISPECIES: hypothetical protein [unclassified Rickettsia]|uniref:hypothetical protein n=1 Tax=unclassified Rickettsia TaxID=114295 RepID=UPI003132D041
MTIIFWIVTKLAAAALSHSSKINKNPLLRSHEVAAAIQAIPNVMRDLIRILNKFSIKICLTGLPRRHFVYPRNDDSGSPATTPAAVSHDVLGIHSTMPCGNDIENNPRNTDF